MRRSGEEPRPAEARSGAPPRKEREWLEARGIRPRKHLGQNFLLDPRVPFEIVQRAAWSPPARVIEIGAGGGALTASLLAAGFAVTAVELDPALVELLRGRFAGEIAAGGLRVVPGDFLDPAVQRTLFGAPPEPTEPPLWLAGNLPYGVTTPILLCVFGLRNRARGAVFMVQREYGERVLARAGDEAYGSLSVWSAAHAESRLLLRVGRSAFWPRPGVESVVLELRFPEPSPFTGDRVRLERVLRAAFGQRRKTMENALSHGLARPKEETRRWLLETGIDPSARAETVPLEGFAALAARLGDAGGTS